MSVSPLLRNVLCVLFLLVVAGIAVFSHHLYLARFDGRPVGDTKSQYWIKGGSNTFAFLAQALLAGSVSVALLDVVSHRFAAHYHLAAAHERLKTWFYVRRKAIALKHLDDVFSLPSLFYTFRFLFSSASWSLPLVLVLVLGIQVFALIPVMTPNVLNVVPGPERTVNLSVPTVDMSQIPMDSSVTYWNSLSGPFYVSPSTLFLKLAQQTYTAASPLSLTVPSGCETSCTYSVQFAGPHLQCSDIDSSVIGDPDPLSPPLDVSAAAIELPAWRQMKFGINDTVVSASEWNLHGLPLFNATSNLNPAATIPTDDVTLTVAYLPARVYCSNGSDIIDNYRCSYVAEEPRGSVCRFRSATYEVDVQFANHTQSISSRVLTVGDSLVFSSADLSGSDPSYLSLLSQRALADAFRLFIHGSIYGTVLRPLPPATIDTTSIHFTSLFSFAQPGPDGLAYTFAPAVQNVSQGLTDLFANITLSLMSTSAGFDGSIRTTALAKVVPAASVWVYNRRRLALVYGIALGVAVLCDAVGLVCLYANGEPGSKAFSRIIAATRTPGLEHLVVADHREARRTKLHYGLVESTDGAPSRTGFGVVGMERIIRIPRR